MKTINLSAAFFLTTFLLACSSSKDTTGLWITKSKNPGRSYNNIFIIANTADIQLRVLLEKGMAAAAEAKGYTVVKSMDMIPPSLNDPKRPSKEEIENKLKATGCNVFAITNIMNKEEAIEYDPGTKKTPGGYGALTWLLAYALGYKGNIPPPETSSYPAASSPGSYIKGKSYCIISDLFDASSEEIICSVKSDPFEEPDLNTVAMNYMTRMVKQLEAEKILIK